ncbi:MAG: hypothetical protein AB8B69_27590 [Chitinophagales bacterium]
MTVYLRIMIGLMFLCSCNSTKQIFNRDIEQVTIVAINYKDLGVTTMRENIFDEPKSGLNSYSETIQDSTFIRQIKERILKSSYLKPQKRDFWNLGHDVWLGLAFQFNESEKMYVTFSREGYIKIGNNFYEYDDGLANLIHEKLPLPILKTLPEDYPSCKHYKMTRKRIRELNTHRRRVSKGLVE